MIELQQAAMRELSTPIIEVWAGVLCLPVVGIVDSQRSAEMTESLLEMVVTKQASTAIVDITGIDVMDTKTADHFIKMAKANFYPNINLLAYAGLNAFELKNFLRADAREFGVAPAVSLPLFNGGSLRAELGQQTALYGVSHEGPRVVADAGSRTRRDGTCPSAVAARARPGRASAGSGRAWAGGRASRSRPT